MQYEAQILKALIMNSYFRDGPKIKALISYFMIR